MVHDEEALGENMREYETFVQEHVSLELDTKRERLMLGCFGLAGESGEVVDTLKKAIFHGRDIGGVTEKVLLEMGDVLWYYVLLLSTLGITLDEVITANIAKLDKRHAEGYYTPWDDLNRDTGVEQPVVKAPLDFEYYESDNGC
jgi:NTP pyrophosphatase (non-canonical NTP hydrolase)